MTAALPSVARVGVAAGWHASPSTNAPAVAHLMPTTWAADGRKTRPALCGERRMRWTTANAVDRQLTPCDACLSAAEALPAPGKPVRIAPSGQPRAERIVGRVSEPGQPNSALDRLGRRIAFREIVVLSDEALDYLDEQMRRLYDRELLALTADVFRAPAPDDEHRPGEDDVTSDPDRPLAYSSTS